MWRAKADTSAALTTYALYVNITFIRVTLCFARVCACMHVCVVCVYIWIVSEYIYMFFYWWCQPAYIGVHVYMSVLPYIHARHLY
jgi:hypothetical protein